MKRASIALHAVRGRAGARRGARMRSCLVALAACASSSCRDADADVTTLMANLSPVCALPSQIDFTCQGAQTTVQLDASGSIDPEGERLVFSWTTDCPGGVFDDRHSATPLFTVPTPNCTLECGVTLTLDDGVEMSSCALNITISPPPNLPPVCVLPPQIEVVCPGSVTHVMLDGSRSYDPEGLPLQFNWSTDCNAGQFDDPHSATPLLSVLPWNCALQCTVTLTVDDAEQQSSCAMELTITPPLPPPAASTASGRVTHARLQSRTSRPPRLIDPLLGDAGVASFALVSSLAIPNGSHATAIVLRVAPDEHATDFAHVVVTESDPCGAWVAPAQMDTSIAVIREVLGAPPPARITVELRDAANRRLERSELRLSHECVALFSYPGSRLSLEAVRTVCDEPRTYPAPR